MFHVLGQVTDRLLCPLYERRDQSPYAGQNLALSATHSQRRGRFSLFSSRTPPFQPSFRAIKKGYNYKEIVNDVVAEIDKLLRRLISEDIDLVTIRNPGLGSIKADPNQLSEVIVNLAVNSRDAMPNGGKLTIETDNVYLDEAYARNHIPSAQDSM
ncbi:MAG: hypothetical protein H0U18_11450 [Pyrinomonadaceae bacterium]|nr:hypothetical protein [Pyrinomonadaceae bacterium]